VVFKIVGTLFITRPEPFPTRPSSRD
jgi:hypothetical protein